MSRSDPRRVLTLALAVCAGMFLFGFAMVPLYRLVCGHVLGILAYTFYENPLVAGTATVAAAPAG